MGPPLQKINYLYDRNLRPLRNRVLSMVAVVHGIFEPLRKAMNPSESSYRALEEGSGGPFQAFFNPLGLSFHTRGSGCPLQHQHLPQVVAYPLQPEVTSIAHPTHIATSFHPIAAFQGADDPLHGPADSRIEFIAPLLLRRYGAITPGPIDDAAEHSSASQRLLAGIFGIGSIGKDRSFIAPDHLFEPMRLGDAGRSQSQMPDQAAALIHGEVDFVAEVPSLPRWLSGNCSASNAFHQVFTRICPGFIRRHRQFHQKHRARPRRSSARYGFS